jgi:hypothetical protein
LDNYYIHQAKKSKVLKPSPGRDWLAEKFKTEQMEMPIYHGKRTAPDKSKKLWKGMKRAGENRSRRKRRNFYGVKNPVSERLSFQSFFLAYRSGPLDKRPFCSYFRVTWPSR